MIRLFLRAGQPGVRKAIFDAIPSPLHAGIDDVDIVKRQDIPRRADFILHTGQGRPTTAAEGFAAGRGTYLTCIPEAAAWFQSKLSEHLAGNDDTVILDAGLHRVLRVQ